MSEPTPDIDAGVVGTGCAYSCGLGCLPIVVVILIAGVAGGAAITRIAGPLAFFGFLAGLTTHVAVGYFTARAARDKGVAVNMHIFVVGGLLMIVGVLGLVSQTHNTVIPRETQALQKVLGLISWLCILPLMLFGASLHSNDEAPVERGDDLIDDGPKYP